MPSERKVCLSGKGLTSGPNPRGAQPGIGGADGQYSGAMLTGALTVVPVPDAATLQTLAVSQRPDLSADAARICAEEVSPAVLAGSGFFSAIQLARSFSKGSTVHLETRNTHFSRAFSWASFSLSLSFFSLNSLSSLALSSGFSSLPGTRSFGRSAAIDTLKA